MIAGISNSECDPPGVIMVGTTVMVFTPSSISFSTSQFGFLRQQLFLFGANLFFYCHLD